MKWPLYMTALFVAACSNYPADSIDQNVSQIELDSKICAGFDASTDSNSAINTLLYELESRYGGEVLDDHPRYYYRNRELDYYIVYYGRYPYYGSLLQVYHLNQQYSDDMDESVGDVVTVLPGWKNCIETRSSTISRF